MPTSSKPISIGLFGFSHRDAQVFMSFCDLLEGRLGVHVRVSEDHFGDVVILDVESGGTLTAMGRGAGGSQTWVAYGTRPPQHDTRFQYFLEKPVRFHGLRELLEQITGQPATEPAPGQPAQTASPGSRRLYHFLRETQRIPPLVIHDGQTHLRVDPQAGRYSASAFLTDMEPLFLASVDQLQLTPASPQDRAEVAGYATHGPLIHALWQAAVVGSGGGLPRNASVDDTYHLRRWPDLGTLHFRPSYPRLCAYLTRHRATARETAGATEVAISEIANFLCACEICGYLDIESASPQSRPHHITRLTDEKQTFLKRLRKHLKLNAAG